MATRARLRSHCLLAALAIVITACDAGPAADAADVGAEVVYRGGGE